MRRGLLALACAALGWTTSVAAQDMTAEERGAVERAGALGQAVYAHDRAAWVATDAAVAKLGRERLTGTGGWVVEPASGGALTVTFYLGATDAAVAVFVATVRDGKVEAERVPAQGTTLTPAQRSLAVARDAAAREALARRFAPCTKAPFNTVVLPPASEGGETLVYLLSAQVQNDVYPAGGHYRMTVGADGRVRDARPFTKSCLQVGPPPQAKDQPAFLVVSHLLDPTPTELHVFTSYAARLPLFVVTGKDRFWRVAGRSIAPVTPPAK